VTEPGTDGRDTEFGPFLDPQADVRARTGAGCREREFAAFAVPTHERGPRLREGDEAMEDSADRFLLGTPSDAAAELERYERELGANHVVLRVAWSVLEGDRARECPELIGAR